MERLTLRRRRVITWTVVSAVLLGGLAWALGVSLIQSVLLALAASVVGAGCLAVSGVVTEPTLPPLQDSDQAEGTRREVSRLSWALGGRDRAGAVPYRRLRAIATHRLALRWIDPATPEGDQAARELLGPLGYTQLVAESNAAPSVDVFAACVALLERLDETSGVTAGSTAAPEGSSRAAGGRRTG